MWRLILVVFLFTLIIWIIRAPARREGSGSKEKEFVRDALTGVYFAKTDAITIVKGGELLYFSSVENRDLWLHQYGRLP
ncbi:MAG: hypothetical protein LBE31_09325 [Deltaproteobacteria bacterium]|jgi:hypothetical protein|nr:hypothetical protein [Deltaproteobacteria bacterium]